MYSGLCIQNRQSVIEFFVVANDWHCFSLSIKMFNLLFCPQYFLICRRLLSDKKVCLYAFFPKISTTDHFRVCTLVSYTHLDVYKRQIFGFVYIISIWHVCHAPHNYGTYHILPIWLFQSCYYFYYYLGSKDSTQRDCWQRWS